MASDPTGLTDDIQGMVMNSPVVKYGQALGSLGQSASDAFDTAEQKAENGISAAKQLAGQGIDKVKKWMAPKPAPKDIELPPTKKRAISKPASMSKR